MMADRFTVIIDACVLYSVLKRNIILSLAEKRLFKARFSQRILDELERSLAKNILDAPQAKKQRQRIQGAQPWTLVTIDADIEAALNLPDKDDNHVLAAAIKVGAGLIVTENLKDFPQDILAKHETRAINADSFIADLIFSNPQDGIGVLYKMLERSERPPKDISELIVSLTKEDMTQTADLLVNFFNP